MKTKAFMVFAVAIALLSRAMAQVVHYGDYYELSDTLAADTIHEYTANSYINLNYGFHSEPGIGNWTSLQLDMGGYEIHPPEAGLTNSNGCVVGSLGGVVDISAMGGLIYTIPLDLPQGINGMQPNLSITYNSQAGNGIMGWGWDLGGLSSITRTGQTLYHDGRITGVNLSWNDRFLLDGKRLVEVADYTDSIEYRMEQDEMAKIMAYFRYEQGGAFGYGTVRVLDHFVVWTADGLVMKYGTTQSSWIEPQSGGHHALCWLLSEMSDRNGNSVLYHYHEEQAQGTHYVDTIKYTANAAQEIPAQFLVTFEYKNHREDHESFFIAGNQVQMQHLLKSVLVSSQTNARLLRYDFNYTWNNNRLYYNLLSAYARSFDENGMMERINETRFVWDSSYGDQLVQYTITDPDIFTDFPFPGDFNGDGYTDVALVPYKDSTVYNGPVNINIYINDRNQGFEHVVSMDLSVSASLDWIHVLDINGDGLDDLVPYFYDTVPSAGTEHSIVAVYINNPTTHTFSLEHSLLIHRKGNVIVGDFNGNGNTDVILLEKKTSRVAINPGIGWYERIPFIENAYYFGYQNSQFLYGKLNGSTLEGLGPAYNTVVADYDGDGTSEVLLVGIDHNNTSYHGSKICEFDFTGNNNGCVVLQDFSSFQPRSDYPYQRIGSEQPWCPVIAGDYNGDGKMDIVYYHLGKWRICISEGDYIGRPHEILSAGLPTLNCGVNLFYPSLNIVRNVSHNFMATCVAADFDGDGCTDLGYTYESSHEMCFASRITEEGYCCARFRRVIHTPVSLVLHSQFLHLGNYLGRDNTSFLCSLEPEGRDGNLPAKILSLRPVSLYNSVTSVIDGLGNKTTFTYDYLTPKASGTANPFYAYSYAAPNAYSVRPVPLPVRALKTCSVEGVNDSKVITRYRYGNAMYHRRGHGFLGFSSTTAETYHNSTDSLWTTKKVSYNESSTMGQYAMLLPQRETTFINDNGYPIPVNKTYYSFTNVKFASNLTDLVVCPAMTGKVEETYSMDEDDELIATDTNSYQYDYNSNHTYNNAYGCTNTTRIVTRYDSGSPVTELRTEKEAVLQTMGPSWIVNRPFNETVTRTRNGQSVTTHTVYAYVSNNSYQPQTVTVVPSDRTHPHDPLSLSTTYDYDVFGNVIEVVTEAPYGIHDEEPRIKNYEYGSQYQHRLLTKETNGRPSNGYATYYTYDFHDRPAIVTDHNGKQTQTVSSILGTDQGVFLPDGTERRSLTLWADESPYKPQGACYYTWSKKTGGVTAMTFYHKSGLELRHVTYDFQGRPVYTDKRYNAKGLLEGESAPYRRGEPVEDIQWTVYHYDFHDRVSRVDYPDGSAKTISYDGLETTTTVTPPQGSPSMTPQTTVQKVNALGWLRESVDAGGTSVFYEYYADGNPKWTRVGNDEATKISMEYDHAGNRTRLHDPDYCTAQKDLVSVYNAFGEEVSRTTPKDYVTTYIYDDYGRLTEREEEDEVEPGVVEVRTTTWNYSETVPSKGLLSSIVYPGQTISYAYDTCQRVVSDTVRYPGGETYVTRYDYDQASRLASTCYPSGVDVSYRYNTTGYPCSQVFGKDTEVYRTQSTTPLGQTERFVLGGVLQNTLEYDPEKHLLTRIKSRKNGAFIQDFSYTYDGFCNLATRKDNMRNLEETFGYDSQNRLTGVWLGSTQTGSSAYDGYGRMTAKTAGGHAVFSNPSFVTGKPHALASATTAEGVFPSAPQAVTYTGFDKVSKVKQGVDSICYAYGYDQQRTFMEEHVGSTVRTKRYVGNCEYITETNASNTDTQWLTYLSGPTGVYAVVLTKSGSDQIFYILKDNLGSWTAITDDSGNTEQRLSYDAWGNLRNPQTWSGDFSGTPMFDRGFTGHEHLYNFDLINMNGRMYDPVVSSFLSVDQYVSSPENAQGFNRYAYCMNNPLKYVDPSGWRPIGGSSSGYFPNTASNFDPYVFYGGRRPLEPRDLGLRQLGTTDPIITWMEDNSLHGGGGGGAKGGWYISDGEIYWSPTVSSQNDLQKLGIEGNFIGQSFIDELNHTYYSLLGYSIDMNEGNGLAGKIAPLIDEAFINYETYRKEMDLNSSGEEPEQRWTNFINVVAYDNNRKGPQEYCFNLGPIECHFVVGNTENSMKARVEHVDLDKIKPDVNNGYGFVKWPSGYDIHFISRASYLDSNPQNSRTITLIVPPSHWDTFKNKYRAVFFYIKP